MNHGYTLIFSCTLDFRTQFKVVAMFLELKLVALVINSILT